MKFLWSSYNCIISRLHFRLESANESSGGGGEQSRVGGRQMRLGLRGLILALGMAGKYEEEVLVTNAIAARTNCAMTRLTHHRPVQTGDDLVGGQKVAIDAVYQLMYICIHAQS